MSEKRKNAGTVRIIDVKQIDSDLVNDVLGKKEAEKSLCAICNQPVLYSEFGGVNKDKEGKIRVFHEECIIREKEGYKITSLPTERPLSDDEITNLKKLLEAYLTIEQKGWLNTIIEEARKQAVIDEDILKRMAKESEELLNNTKELEKIAERRMKEIDDLKKQLKESEQKTVGLLKEIENIADEETDGSDAQVSLIVIKKEEWQKLKEKYGEKK